MKTVQITKRDIKVERDPHDSHYINGTIGKSIHFSAYVETRTLFLSLKRDQVKYLVIHEKRKSLPKKALASYDCKRGILPSNKKTRQLVSSLISFLEWYQIY